ncbi:MFS transporter [Novosphingobium resinovorum]|uniref:MFS transporter n=1 Tax=Novosphingobium TaxID=165696 RepID=UPI001B3C846D|nr:MULTISPECIES: MFS transporter [Novosphingobium]MBF7013584.1 MFS transporter [Novosphingobium sp. HR1a]WJM26279.1 MFS transporter [Novosphingobium resinovorum]
MRQSDFSRPAPRPDDPRGWAVVVAAMVGVALGLSPIPFYTIGMLAPQLSAEFGWSFAALMASITVQSGVVMIASPLAGIAIDRFGARPVALVSLPLFGLSFMSLALSNGSLTLYYAQWVIMAVLGVGTLSATWTRVVTQWFDKWRGMALGLASCGTGITGFIIKPLCAHLIETHGWRTAVVVVGCLPIVVGVPVVALLFREMARGAAAPDKPLEAAEEVVQPGLTLAEAARDRRLWIMAGAFLFIAFALTAPTPNLENILKTRAFTLPQIGEITAAFGLSVIAGRLIGGWLLDRFWAPLIALVILAFPALGCWLLTSSTLSPLIATLAVISLGFGAGFEFDLLAYLISRFFGQRHYGAIYGCFYAVIAFAGGLGPVVFGYVFDRIGDYTIALRSGSACLVVGAVLLLAMGAYPKLSEK